MLLPMFHSHLSEIAPLFSGEPLMGNMYSSWHLLEGQAGVFFLYGKGKPQATEL